MKLTIPTFLLYCLIVVCSHSKVLADWIDITQNLPEDYDLVFESIYGDLRSPDPIVAVATIDQSIFIETARSVFRSTDGGQTFLDTNPPFDLTNQTLLTRRVTLRPCQASARLYLTIDDDGTPVLYSYSMIDHKWSRDLEIIPDINSSVYGTFAHYSYDPVTETHYAVSQWVDQFPDDPEYLQQIDIYSFVWKLGSTGEWSLISEDPSLYGQCYDLVTENGSIYLRLEEGLYTTHDDGEIWHKTTPLESGRTIPPTSAAYFAITIPRATPQFPPIQVLSSNHPNFLTNDYGNRMSVHPEYGIGTSFSIVDRDGETLIESWLPLDIACIAKINDQYFVVGNPYENDGEDINTSGVYFTANNGRSWDHIDSMGISYPEGASTGWSNLDFPSRYDITDDPNAIIIDPPFEFADPDIDIEFQSFHLADQIALIVTNRDRLWARQISEIDLIPSTTILSQPKNKTVALSGTANLQVEATGSPPLNYQWHKNGEIIDGETAATLEITEFSVAHEGFYSVSVSGQNGVVMSDPSILAIGLTYEEYATAQFPLGKRSPDDDARENGITNLEEFLFGEVTYGPTLPLQFKSAEDLGLFFADDSEYLTLTYRIRSGVAGYTARVRAAENLSELETADDESTRPVGGPIIDGDFETRTYRSRFTTKGTTSGFIHLVIDKD